MGRPAGTAAMGIHAVVLAFLVVVATLAASAGALSLSTARPRGIKGPTTPAPRTTPKYMRDFKDGEMDEEESDPITRPLAVEDQKVPTKAPKPAKVTAAPEPDANTAVYKLLDSRNNACILFKVDALLIFKFRTVHEEDAEKDVFIPNNARVTGDCGSGDDAYMSVAWQDMEWTSYFTKTPGGERWYIEKSDLSIDTSNTKVFEHIKNPGRKMKLTSGRGNLQLFPTPVGKSYSCSEGEKAVDMSYGDVTVQLLLRDVRVQPFIFRKGEFGPEFVCSPGGVSYRDETAPIAVGSTLAIVVLCTITGYGAFRYFKIKKVQYDTME
ncbi:hypothetical protein FOCC_FOCC000381 [Frankliniella occidentalis]|uniref:Uncharacterized protein LOC113214012 n=1 Tax=Frankliniella occidentalis TaxID=133901 RepID=A0A6J1TDV2_FRAOC|nr:uncharacterized protein LOC113214012 [Frankliniella occidentalis]KAE8753036.1 hypothetical protein FOCC_FOCC000381 [Frankliniella occidentalis]